MGFLWMVFLLFLLGEQLQEPFTLRFGMRGQVFPMDELLHGLPTAWNLSVLEQWWIRPVAALDLFDRLVVVCGNLAFDIDLFFFDQARGFVGLF
jgi:hypothetical protein